MNKIFLIKLFFLSFITFCVNSFIFFKKFENENLILLLINGGLICSFICFYFFVCRKKILNNKYKQKIEKNFPNLISNSGIPFVLVDDCFNIVYYNKAFSLLFDIRNQNINFEHNFFKEFNIKSYDGISISFYDKSYANSKSEYFSDFNGFTKYLSIDITKSSFNNGFLLFIDDITEYKNTEKKLHTEIYTDPLTKKLNKKAFFENFNEIIKSYKKNNGNHESYLAFLNLDNFNSVNNFSGYESGNSVLIEFSNLVSNYIKDEKIKFYHLGGDEFILLYDKWNKNEVELHIKELFSFFSQNIKFNSADYELNTSIGIVSYPYNGHSVDMLIKNAVVALKKSKETFGNSYSFFDSDMSNKILEKQEILLSMKNSLANNKNFSLVYQPKIDIQKETICLDGVEVLLRWKHNNISVSPAKFIPIAEESDLINDIFKYVFINSISELEHLLGKEINSFSVNLSAKQLSSLTYINDLISFLEKHSAYSKFVTLEVTETCIMDNSNISIKALEKIKSIGYKISIDDFGTGHSSLSQMKSLPIDELKIDRSFISNIPNPTDENILSLIINLSNAFKLKTVAEGVETFEQAEHLLKSGCDTIQGFYYSKPLEISQLNQYIKNLLI